MRTEPFIRRRLDADPRRVEPERIGDLLAHRRKMRADLRRFRDQRRVDICRSRDFFLARMTSTRLKISRLLIPRIDSSVFGK